MKLYSVRELYGGLPLRKLADAGISIPQYLVEQLQANLPAAFNEGCLEWTLSAGKDEVDLWCVIPAHEGAREESRSFAKRSNDTDLGRLLLDWSDPDCVLSKGVADLFLEFDHGGAGIPVVLARLQGEQQSKLQTIDAFVGTMAGRRVDDAEAEWLEKVAALAGDIRVVCWLGTRGLPTFRIVCTVNVLGVARWLDELEVKRGRDVEAVLDSIESFAYVVGLQLSPGNHDEFGMEVYLPQSDVNQAHERRLFKRLSEMGAMDAAKGRTLSWWAQPDRSLFRTLLVKPRFFDGALKDCKGYLGFSPTEAL